ncbi:MAG: DUF6588 family protein [Sphingobacterium thalpophilum]
MKSHLRYRTIITGLLLVLPGFVYSQSDVSGVFKSSPADATKLAQAYLKPFFKGLGTGLNSGWNNSAHSKNLLRFDLRFGITGAVVPQPDETFDISKIGLSNSIRPTNPAQIMSSTVSGSKDYKTQMTVYDGNNQALETFTLPGGNGIGLIPAPQLQGSIGLSRGLELSVRAMPTVKLGSDFGSIGMFGGGFKLELIPLFSGVADKVLPLDIALAAGYTRFSYELPLNVSAPSNALPASPTQSNNFTNQRVEANFSGINTEFIISKRILLFTPFISLGYNRAETDAGMKGNFPIINGVTPLGQRTYSVFTDPINIQQTDINGFRTNIGFQLNLAFFRIYGSYSMAEYNSFNGGIGLGLGK